MRLFVVKSSIRDKALHILGDRQIMQKADKSSNTESKLLFLGQAHILGFKRWMVLLENKITALRTF